MLAAQGGTDIAILRAMLPPAEKPEIARRVGSSVMVVLSLRWVVESDLLPPPSRIIE